MQLCCCATSQSKHRAMQKTTASLGRRLAALVAADVVGYSRLIASEEERTIRTLAERRSMLTTLAEQYGGRLVNAAGDGFLFEFASAVEALRWALGAQQKNVAENKALPSDQQVSFRMGAHLGDIVVQGDDLLGDGVNVAARLEALADPDGILASDRIRDETLGRLDAVFTDRGEHELKNIPGSRRAYSVSPSSPGVDRANREADQAPLVPRGRPSLAVLPFTNMSGDPEQAYFADGVVEDIITALSQVRRFFVIARNSSFTYKDRAIDIRQVGRELGVQYVLEGSIRRSGNRIRITGQLIEAATGRHVWADRFDGAVEDVFELQDRITEQVAGAVAPHLLEAEVARVIRRPVENLDAYDLFLRALPEIRSMTRDGVERAIALAERALSLDPEFAVAAALGAWAYTLRAAHSWREDPDRERAQALALAHRALQFGQDDADALAMAGYTIGFLGEDLGAGLAAIERALSISPSSALAHANSGWLLAYNGSLDEAVARFGAALRLSPRDPDLYRIRTGLAFALLLSGNASAAADQAREAVNAKPSFAPAHRALLAALHHCARPAEAAAAARTLLALLPHETVDAFVAYSLFRYSGRLEVITSGLRAAGIP